MRYLKFIILSTILLLIVLLISFVESGFVVTDESKLISEVIALALFWQILMKLMKVQM
jgi:hypothetical protein